LSEIMTVAEPGSAPLFDTLLSPHSAPVRAPVHGPAIVSLETVEYCHYPLVVTCGPAARLRLSYRPELLPEAAVQAIADRLLAVLATIVTPPLRTAGSVDVLLPAERRAFARLRAAVAEPPRACLP